MGDGQTFRAECHTRLLKCFESQTSDNHIFYHNSTMPSIVSDHIIRGQPTWAKDSEISSFSRTLFVHGWSALD